MSASAQQVDPDTHRAPFGLEQGATTPAPQPAQQPAPSTTTLPDPDLGKAPFVGAPAPPAGGGQNVLVNPSSGTQGRAPFVRVLANGTDNFVDAEFHTIENIGTVGISSVTLDISIVAGAFWDFDGSASFANATDPVLAASSTYAGVVTWTHGAGYPNDPVVTANFAPPLDPGRKIVFGADTDFFVTDPCPGENFGLAPARISAVFATGATCAGPYVVTAAPTTSEARCSIVPRGGHGLVIADGTDNFVDADFHTIANCSTSGLGIRSVTMDIGGVAGAFWDFDGSASFGNATEPVLSALSTYGGTVTWTHGAAYPNDPVVTANFSPPLATLEEIVFGADTDFFVSDPCPGSNFAGNSRITVTFEDGSVCFDTYDLITTSANRSEAACGVNGGGPVLTAIGLVAGGADTFTVTGATPGGRVYYAYSTAGGGPGMAPGGPCGPLTVALSAPYVNFPFPVIADPGGNAVFVGAVPGGTTGVTVWFQAFDLGSCQLTNGVVEIID